MIKVDKEGVPRLVQLIEYRYKDYTCKITFFNRRQIMIDPEYIMRYPPKVTDLHINKEELADAYIAAEKRGLELLYDR